MTNKYNCYMKIKSDLKGLYYKGYPLDFVLGSYIAMMVWKPSYKIFRSYIFFNASRIPDIESRKVIYTLSTKRDDYLGLYSGYFKDLDYQYVRVRNRKVDFFLTFFSSIYFLIKAFFYVGKNGSGFLDKFYLSISVSLAYKIINELERRDIKCKKYVAFNSSYLIESFLSFYFRNRGVDTYSLQHGMYCQYSRDKELDVINYENICAAEFLAWGQYTKEQIEPMAPSHTKISVFGYPKPTVNPDRIQDERILVLLPRDIYWADSKRLMKFLVGKEQTYLIRSHPSIKNKTSVFSSENIFFDENETLSKTMRESKFKAVISFNSTAIFEAYLFEQNVIFFNSQSKEFENPGFQEISLKSNLKKCLRKNYVIERNVNYFFEGAKDTLL